MGFPAKLYLVIFTICIVGILRSLRRGHYFPIFHRRVCYRALSGRYACVQVKFFHFNVENLQTVKGISVPT